MGLVASSCWWFLGRQQKRATSVSDRTTLLFAMPQYRVLDVTLEPGGSRRVLVENVAQQGGCPACGVLSGVVKDRPMSRVKDLPHGLVPLVVWVRKRRFVCAERLCTRRSFTETSSQLPARARVTTRLKVRVCAAVATTNRAVSEVATDHGIAWWTVHRILVKAAADVLRQAVVEPGSDHDAALTCWAVTSAHTARGSLPCSSSRCEIHPRAVTVSTSPCRTSHRLEP